MKISRALLLTLLVLQFAGASSGQEKATPAAAAARSAASPAELITSLGSPSWREREAAQEELLKRFGQDIATRDAVSAAMTNSDPEVALRAAQIVDRQSHAHEEKAIESFRLDPGHMSFEAMLLVVARAVDPGADVVKAEAQLSEWSETLRARIGAETNAQVRLRRVVDFHFVVQELIALLEREPDALTLIHALGNASSAEKHIDPLMLALLIKVVAHRAGVELALARCDSRVMLVDLTDAAQPRWVDLHQNGKTLDREEVTQLLLNLPRAAFDKQQLEPESDRATLDRYLGEITLRCRWFAAGDIAIRVAGIQAQLAATKEPEHE